MVNKRVLESLGKQSDLSGTQLPAHHHKTEITKLKEGGIFGYKYRYSVPKIEGQEVSCGPKIEDDMVFSGHYEGTECNGNEGGGIRKQLLTITQLLFSLANHC